MFFSSKLGRTLMCGGFLFTASIAQAATISNLPDISLLTPYVELGKSEVESLTTITGNVAVSDGGSLSLNAPSKIIGDVYVGIGASFSHPGIVTGTIHTGVSLSAAQAQVFSASTTLAGLTPDVTISAVQTTALSYNVAAGSVKVVDLNGGLNLNNANITLTGGGYLVLNIQGSFDLVGTASILGPDATHILINYTGTTTMNTHVGDVVDGLVFIPNAAATLDGAWTGGLYGGTHTITLLSGLTLNAPTPPTSPVPDGGNTVLLLAAGLGLLVFVKRKSIV